MSYPQFGHPIGGNFARVCTIHHRAHPIARTPAQAATAAIASSDNTNQISSGHVSIPNPLVQPTDYTICLMRLNNNFFSFVSLSALGGQKNSCP